MAAIRIGRLYHISNMFNNSLSQQLCMQFLQIVAFLADLYLVLMEQVQIQVFKYKYFSHNSQVPLFYN